MLSLTRPELIHRLIIKSDLSASTMEVIGIRALVDHPDDAEVRTSPNKIRDLRLICSGRWNVERIALQPFARSQYSVGRGLAPCEQPPSEHDPARYRYNPQTSKLHRFLQLTGELGWFIWTSEK